jgi:hypothetical protein
MAALTPSSPQPATSAAPLRLLEVAKMRNPGLCSINASMIQRADVNSPIDAP